MNALSFAIASLAVWRITYAIINDDLPFNVGGKFRKSLKIDNYYPNKPIKPGSLRKLFTCPYCLSLWVAIPFTFWLTEGVAEWFVVYYALGAAAVFIDKVHSKLNDE